MPDGPSFCDLETQVDLIILVSEMFANAARLGSSFARSGGQKILRMYEVIQFTVVILDG